MPVNPRRWKPGARVGATNGALLLRGIPQTPWEFPRNQQRAPAAPPKPGRRLSSPLLAAAASGVELPGSEGVAAGSMGTWASPCPLKSSGGGCRLPPPLEEGDPLRLDAPAARPRPGGGGGGGSPGLLALSSLKNWQLHQGFERAG